MNESLWMYFFMMMGIFGIVMINVFGQVLLSNEQNYYLLKESTEAAMYDAIDLNAYRGDGEWELGEGNSCVPKVPGTIKITREKFVESFARRFANSANLDRQYRVIFNDIDECPPKVSISLIASERFSMLEIFNVTYDTDTSIINNLSGIIEADLKNFEPAEHTPGVNVCDGEKTSSDSYSEWSTCNYATNTQSRYKTTQYRVGSTLCGTTKVIEEKECFTEIPTTATQRYCTKAYNTYPSVVTYGEYGACNSLTGKKTRQKITEYIDGTVRCKKDIEYEQATCTVPNYVIPSEINICDHPEMFPQECEDNPISGWSSCVNSTQTQKWKRICRARGIVCKNEEFNVQQGCYSPPPTTESTPYNPPSSNNNNYKPSTTQKPSATVISTTNDSCFLKGTSITTQEGYKNIEDIKVGDMVLSYNEEKGVNEFSRVNDTFIHDNVLSDLYTLTIEGVDLQVTAIHNFYIKRIEDGKEIYDYIAAEDLKVGDQVRYSNGTYHTIEKIIDYYQRDTYYDIEVDNNHNYYVSEQKILVHNKSKGTRDCFPGGTLVKVENGYENIEDIKVGDKVYTYNADKKIIELKTVVEKYKHGANEIKGDIYTIHVDGISFRVTGIHGIYIKRHLFGLLNFEGYMAAKKLKVGDQLRYSDGSFHAIDDINYKNENEIVYNMTIEDNHNYFVTEKEITVHNTDYMRMSQDMK